jgi:two-component system, chemotaxis family, sensor kinase CheA
MHADACGMGFKMDDIVKDFLIESRENLDRLDQELVSLESDPTSKELLGSVFRTIHTIKGSCGFLGFARLQKVAHAGENLLSKLRDGALPLDAEITSGLLAMVDAVRHMLVEIQTGDSDGENDYPELLDELKRLQRCNPAPAVPEPELVTTAAPPPKLGAVLVERGCLSAQDLELALQKQREGDCRRLGQILIAMRFCTQQEIDAAQQVLEARGRSSVETVRVSVDLLDALMNLIGELVLARNQLLQLSNGSENADLQSASQRVNLIVSQVQEQVIRTRMQPISNIWNKFPRTVRDLARSWGKDVRVEMEGQDTELDRTVMEAIRDPLTHLVRNAIDHGIETPEMRQTLGKNACGKLHLRAFQQGGKVTVEVIDDGAGLNLEALCSKAVERGLVTAQQATRISEREISNLIFLPGLSTAKAVTSVSGRGVGMDVVKTNVERISGAIDIESIAGQGTTVRIKIPLTVAIVSALIVRCRNERVAIPQATVLELVGLDGTGASPQIETVHGQPVYRLRGNLLPLIDLDRELNLGAALQCRSKTANIVVLQADTRRFGLVVDDILDTEDIVVKPLGEHLKGINAYCGATIMGDGRVVLVLDVVGLAQRARVIRENQELRGGSLSPHMLPAAPPSRQTFLLAHNGPEAQVAIPLSAVARLERLPASLLRHNGEREVVEYREHVIPVLRLSQALAPAEMAQPSESGNPLDAVIYTDQGHTVGVIVDGIIDIVDEQPTLGPLTSRSGVIGAFVSDHHVIETLDLAAIVRTAIPDFGKAAEQAADAG